MGEVIRLGPGDEEAAAGAVAGLRPAEVTGGIRPGPGQLAGFLGDGRNYFILARERSRPVGFLTAYELESFDRDGALVYLYEIGVAPDRRRQGIGRAMIERLEESLRGRRVSHIWAGTTHGNVAAQRLFLSTGARRVAADYVEFVWDLERG